MQADIKVISPLRMFGVAPARTGTLTLEELTKLYMPASITVDVQVEITTRSEAEALIKSIRQAVRQMERENEQFFGTKEVR